MVADVHGSAVSGSTSTLNALRSPRPQRLIHQRAQERLLHRPAARVDPVLIGFTASLIAAFGSFFEAVAPHITHDDGLADRHVVDELNAPQPVRVDRRRGLYLPSGSSTNDACSGHHGVARGETLATFQEKAAATLCARRPTTCADRSGPVPDQRHCRLTTARVIDERQCHVDSVFFGKFRVSAAERAARCVDAPCPVGDLPAP